MEEKFTERNIADLTTTVYVGAKMVSERSSDFPLRLEYCDDRKHHCVHIFVRKVAGGLSFELKTITRNGGEIKARSEQKVAFALSKGDAKDYALFKSYFNGFLTTLLKDTGWLA